MLTHSDFIYHSNKDSSEMSFPHLRSGTEKHAARSQNKRKSCRGSGVVHVSCSEMEKVLSEHRDIRNFLEMRAGQAVRGEKSGSNNIV